MKYLFPLALLLLATPAAAQSSGCYGVNCANSLGNRIPVPQPRPETMSAAESDLAWQLHILANADFVEIGGKQYLRMNPEAMALWQLLRKDH